MSIISSYAVTTMEEFSKFFRQYVLLDRLVCANRYEYIPKIQGTIAWLEEYLLRPICQDDAWEYSETEHELEVYRAELRRLQAKLAKQQAILDELDAKLWPGDKQ